MRLISVETRGSFIFGLSQITPSFPQKSCDMLVQSWVSKGMLYVMIIRVIVSTESELECYIVCIIQLHVEPCKISLTIDDYFILIYVIYCWFSKEKNPQTRLLYMVWHRTASPQHQVKRFLCERICPKSFPHYVHIQMWQMLTLSLMNDTLHSPLR